MKVVPWPLRDNLREPRDTAEAMNLDAIAHYRAIDLASDAEFLADFLTETEPQSPHVPVFAKWLALTCAVNATAAREVAEVIHPEAKLTILADWHKQRMEAA